MRTGGRSHEVGIALAVRRLDGDVAFLDVDGVGRAWQREREADSGGGGEHTHVAPRIFLKVFFEMNLIAHLSASLRL